AVLDRNNKQEPPDVMQAPPGQKIVVDTARPDVRVSADRKGDEVVVRWEAADPNLDPATLKVEFRDGPNGVWSAVSAAAAASGQATFRPGGTGLVALRVQVQDLAGNLGEGVCDLSGPTTRTTALVPPGPAPVGAPVGPVPVLPTWGGASPVAGTGA